MKKHLIIVVLCLTLVIAALVGCESYHQTPISGGDANAEVTSNGGFAVKQGEYLYFVNGLATPSESNEELNYFGNVELGAILRAKYNADSKTYSDVTNVVPKMFYNTYAGNGGGFYIFGQWIYYTSPSKLADKEGVVQIGDTEFLRTKIDGTDTQSICVVEDTTNMQYRFTENGLVYSHNSNLYCVDLSQKSFKNSNGSVKTLAEGVSSFVLPEYSSYNYGTKTMADKLSQYVYYTKPVGDDINTHNLFFVATADGKTVKDISEKLTYQPETKSTSISDTYTFSIIGYSLEEDGLAVYYTKSRYVGSSNSVIGTYGIKFTSEEFADKTDVLFTTLTRTKAANFLGFDKGIYEKNGEIYTIYKQNYVVNPLEDLAYDALVAIRNENGKDYLYFYKSSLLYRYAIAGDENMDKITNVKAKTDWIKGDFVGSDFFFLNADVSNYLYRLDLSTYSRNDVDGEDLTLNFFGLMADEAYATYKAELKEDDEGHSFEFPQE